MRVFFRVHEDTIDSDHTIGELYSEELEQVDPSALDANDVLLKLKASEFRQIQRAAEGGVAAIYFRVHEDKSERDPSVGTWYDTSLNEVKWPIKVPEGFKALILIPVTPEELEITRDARQ